MARIAHGRHTGIVFPHSTMKTTSSFVSVGAALLGACFSNIFTPAAAAEEGASPLRVLFLGDTGHHRVVRLDNRFLEHARAVALELPAHQLDVFGGIEETVGSAVQRNESSAVGHELK